MRIFKNRWFQKWAAKEGLSDEALRAAVKEMEDGLIGAELGGHVVKKRVALPGRGKRGGTRTLVIYQQANKAFFVYGFAKNERTNISTKQLKALRLLATQLLGYTSPTLAKATKAGELIEVNKDD
ncbi:MAG TPA: type II toxin-antitoxin system RelE/ParE family toxin [Gammaproteobacteria bacterium]|nr:type II toxin-antitoxin system RelE/ParE family toxin [Gammaproteobacteria bacterium]